MLIPSFVGWRISYQFYFWGGGDTVRTTCAVIESTPFTNSAQFATPKSFPSNHKTRGKEKRAFFIKIFSFSSLWWSLGYSKVREEEGTKLHLIQSHSLHTPLLFVVE